MLTVDPIPELTHPILSYFHSVQGSRKLQKGWSQNTSGKKPYIFWDQPFLW